MTGGALVVGALVEVIAVVEDWREESQKHHCHVVGPPCPHCGSGGYCCCCVVEVCQSFG